MSQRTRLFPVLVLLVAVATSMIFVPTAEAGCLMEQLECSACAQNALRRAMWRLSAKGIVLANVQLWDCSIDLFHCLLLGQHHNSVCAV